MKQFTQQITLDEMHDEIKRELATRKRIYPRWIEEVKIKKDVADFRILVLEAVLILLYEEIKKNAPQGDLF